MYGIVLIVKSAKYFSMLERGVIPTADTVATAGRVGGRKHKITAGAGSPRARFRLRGCFKGSVKLLGSAELSRQPTCGSVGMCKIEKEALSHAIIQ